MALGKHLHVQPPRSELRNEEGGDCLIPAGCVLDGSRPRGPGTPFCTAKFQFSPNWTPIAPIENSSTNLLFAHGVQTHVSTSQTLRNHCPLLALTSPVFLQLLPCLIKSGSASSFARVPSREEQFVTAGS
eukprot:3402508-Rhodomonas_salina.2